MENFCRTCMKSEDLLIPLEDEWKHRISYSYMLTNLTGILSKGLAKTKVERICSICAKNLVNCYKFKQQCLRCDQQLFARTQDNSQTCVSPEKAVAESHLAKHPIQLGLAFHNAVLKRIINNPLGDTTEYTSEAVENFQQHEIENIANNENEAILSTLQNILSVPSPSNSRDSCSQCNVDFKNHREFLKHNYNVHKKPKSKRKRKLELVPEPKSCLKCNRTFANIVVYRDHVNTFHSKNRKVTPKSEIQDQRTSCLKCSRKCYSNKLYREHYAIEHADQPGFCKKCNEDFGDANGYHEHCMKMHKPGPKTLCTLCGKMIATTAFQIHLNAAHYFLKNFTCLDCGRKFATPCTLKAHRRLHTNEKPYKCDYCEEAFSTLNSKKNHMRRLHTLEKYPCKICGKEFAQFSSLRKHERIHAGILKFQCQYCQMKFVDKTGLKNHVVVHTGERNYHCNWENCGKGFGTPSRLRAHKAQHTGEKNYVCTVCGKEFVYRQVLRSHMRLHPEVPMPAKNAVLSQKYLIKQQEMDAKIALNRVV